jgi:hypothetical protein
VSRRAVESGCPRASRFWFVVLAVTPFWRSSGETRWRSQRTPALNPGRDPSPLPGVCEGAGQAGESGPCRRRAVPGRAAGGERGLCCDPAFVPRVI